MCVVPARRSSARQSLRVHSVDHFIAIMFSYAQVRPASVKLPAPFAHATVSLRRRCLCWLTSRRWTCSRWWLLRLHVRAQRRGLRRTSSADAPLWAVVWLLTAQPLYESAATEALTPAAMETRVLTPEGGAWVVLLQAPWHAGCVYFAPAFAELAQTYGDAVRFGTFDLARWPGLAARYGVDVNGARVVPLRQPFELLPAADSLPAARVQPRHRSCRRWFCMKGAKRLTGCHARRPTAAWSRGAGPPPTWRASSTCPRARGRMLKPRRSGNEV